VPLRIFHRQAPPRVPGAVLNAFRSRRDMVVKNLVLTQQLAAFRARNQRPHIRVCDRAFRIVVRRLWTRVYILAAAGSENVPHLWLRASSSLARRARPAAREAYPPPAPEHAALNCRQVQTKPRRPAGTV
jgi:hypothetical protein